MTYLSKACETICVHPSNSSLNAFFCRSHVFSKSAFWRSSSTSNKTTHSIFSTTKTPLGGSFYQLQVILRYYNVHLFWRERSNKEVKKVTLKILFEWQMDLFGKIKRYKVSLIPFALGHRQSALIFLSLVKSVYFIQLRWCMNLLL